MTLLMRNRASLCTLQLAFTSAVWSLVCSLAIIGLSDLPAGVASHVVESCPLSNVMGTSILPCDIDAAAL